MRLNTFFDVKNTMIARNYPGNSDLVQIELHRSEAWDLAEKIVHTLSNKNSDAEKEQYMTLYLRGRLNQ